MFNTSFSNKTQLKIFFFVLLGWTQFNAFLALNRTGPTGTVENVSTVHVNSGGMLHCSLNKTHEQWSHASLFMGFLSTRSSRELLYVNLWL